MKAISTTPKLNEAFKIVQPLPVLTHGLRVKLDAAAPRFDTAWRATETKENPPDASARGAVEKTAPERNRRGVSAAAALAGITQSCAAMTELPTHGELSRALEIRLIA